MESGFRGYEIQKMKTEFEKLREKEKTKEILVANRLLP